MKNLDNPQQEGNHIASPVRIILAVTSALSCIFLEGPIEMLRKAGFEPILVSSPGDHLYRIVRDAGVRYVAIPMRREISPLRNLLSLWRSYRLMRQVRPTLFARIGWTES